jgi:hypothetical protein
MLGGNRNLLREQFMENFQDQGRGGPDLGGHGFEKYLAKMAKGGKGKGGKASRKQLKKMEAKLEGKLEKMLDRKLDQMFGEDGPRGCRNDMRGDRFEREFQRSFNREFDREYNRGHDGRGCEGKFDRRPELSGRGRCDDRRDLSWMHERPELRFGDEPRFNRHIEPAFRELDQPSAEAMAQRGADGSFKTAARATGTDARAHSDLFGSSADA